MIRAVSPIEAKRLIDEENALLIDIREPDEFADTHIEGARLEPLSVLRSLAPDSDRQRTVIFHCRSGGRTSTNADALEARGFAATCVMEGGIVAWEKAGLPVIKGK